MTFKKSLFDQFARITKAIGSTNRLEILEFLAQCEYSVEELAKLCGLTIANTSHHLQRLRQAGLVTSRKQGTRVFYQLANEEITALIAQLRVVAEISLKEVDGLVEDFLSHKDHMQPIRREQLLTNVQQGLVTVLDVRPSQEYQAGHLPNAINVPLSSLKHYLDNLDPNQEVVAYCRGPYCVLAFDAVNLLRKKGLKARRLEDGFPEWKHAGLPIEKSPNIN